MPISLRIFNFPPIFSSLDVREFLHLFGLQATRLFRRRTSHGAIVSVANEPEVRLVISRLHQLLIENYRLKVEYSDKQRETVVDEESSLIVENKVKKGMFGDIQEGRTNFNYEGFPPPCLRYRYPKHSPTILSNISSQLASNTSFYYQVLHLMNKMNLKTPFESPKLDVPLPSRDPEGRVVQASSEEESELESDDEELSKGKRLKLTRLLQPTKRTMKVVHYNQDVSQSHEVGKNVKKKPNIEIHISKSNFSAGHLPDEPFHSVDGPVATKNSTAPEETDFTLENILANRIPEEQRVSLNVFQNYTPGTPSNKLYIKNLAKSVTEQDLQKIVRVFFGKDSLYNYDVKLMKTGRMKGQAFISFFPLDGDESKQSGELKNCIDHVLKTVNGYILKDKPMVVSYAKSS